MTTTARRTSTLDTRELATLVARATVATGGATLATDGTAPTTGYAVSLPGRESVTVLPTRDAEPFIAAQVVTHLQAHSGDLGLRGNYVGAWVDSGRLYLDVSTVVDTLAAAIKLAVRHHQIAIFGLTEGATIRLVESGQVPA